MSNVLVAGSGLSAACVCYFVNELGHDVYRFAREEAIGGLCADYWSEKGTYVSKYGPHIFHTSEKWIWDFVNKFADWVTYTNSPKALYKGKYYSLPMNMNTFQQVFGVQTASEALLKIKADIDNIHQNDAEAWAIGKMGKTLYEMFFKHYSEKQWKKDVKELPCDTLSRVPLRLWYSDNYFKDLYQGLPKDGYTNFISNILLASNIKDTFIDETGIQFETVAPNFDHVFICDRPDAYAPSLGSPIKYGSTLFKEESLDDWRQDAAVVNHCDTTQDWTRTTDYSLLYPTKRGESIIISETPLGEDCRRYGGVACYPTTDKKYDQYKMNLEFRKYILCGRLAENKYLDMAPAIANAREKVYNLFKENDNDRICKS